MVYLQCVKLCDPYLSASERDGALYKSLYLYLYMDCHCQQMKHHKLLCNYMQNDENLEKCIFHSTK